MYILSRPNSRRLVKFSTHQAEGFFLQGFNVKLADAPIESQDFSRQER
jgi:hypothetical protein